MSCVVQVLNSRYSEHRSSDAQEQVVPAFVDKVAHEYSYPLVLVESLTDLTLGCNRGRSTPPLQTGLALPFGQPATKCLALSSALTLPDSHRCSGGELMSPLVGDTEEFANITQGKTSVYKLASRDPYLRGSL